MAARKLSARDEVQGLAAVRKGLVYRNFGPNQGLVRFDLRNSGMHWEVRHEWGKTLRTKVPREAHAEWKTPKDRPDPVETIERTNRGRLKDLVPIRMGRMAASPYGFLRGAGAVMAWDLARTPVTGLTVAIDGDAHLNNFGLYGTSQREIVFDLNDFDEVTIGPWEWDLKRLVASVNVAGRENGLNRQERAIAVRRCVDGYRRRMLQLERIGLLELWYIHTYPGRKGTWYEFTDAKTSAIFEKAMAKAAATDNMTLLEKSGRRGVMGEWHFREDPPILTRISGPLREQIIDGLNDYAETLSQERRYMLSQYQVADVARRVVGVGSVGTRAYLVLLFGIGDNDPLFLQVKEALAPVHEPYLPSLPDEFRHYGWLTVAGERVLQASTDVMLGYTTIDGRPYYVRQMKNLKGSIPVGWLSGEPFNFYAWMCGSVLARAHARTGLGAAIAGYCGASTVLDDALATFAERYGDQNERDYEALLAAIKSGRVEAVAGV